jgi:hypothetical protein
VVVEELGSTVSQGGFPRVPQALDEDGVAASDADPVLVVEELVLDADVLVGAVAVRCEFPDAVCAGCDPFEFSRPQIGSTETVQPVMESVTTEMPATRNML